LALESYIKIIGYREYIDSKGKLKSKQIFWDEPYYFQNHQTMFNNVETFLSHIPEAERYNLHYTINHVPKGAISKTSVSHIEIIPIDIDNIILERLPDYVKAVETALAMTSDQFVSIATGNGLQFVFLLDKPIKDESEIKALKKSYNLLCEEIDRELERQSLVQTIRVDEVEKTTGCDKQVFRIGTLRVPETRNIKKGYSDKFAQFVTRQMKPVSLEKLRLYYEEIPEHQHKKITTQTYWGKTDSKHIFKECRALETFKEKKGNVSYPEWFSAISVISRLNDVEGEKLAHELSSGHSNYSYDETQNLIENTRTHGGPHTCQTFSQSFKGCQDCKYFNTKLKSPINLKSSEFLSYQATGFHKQSHDGQWKPYYRQIIQKFTQDYNYKVLLNTGDMYCFEQDKNCWLPMPPLHVKSEIYKLFSTKPGDVAGTRITQETFQHLTLTNGIEDELFLEKSRGKVNFVNGHIEVKGFELKFFPVAVDSFKEYFTFSLPFKYDPKAECPHFLDFLDAVSLSREDIQVSLCEFMGYVMSNDDYWAHKFLMLEGPGSNGKSIVLDLLRYLVGEGNYSALGIRDMADDQKKAGLVGKIANISDEQPKKNFLDSSDLKNLTAGGDFNYKRLYLQPGIAKCRAKFVFSTNHPFTTTDSSNGTKRRYHPIPFDANFDPEAGPVTRTPDVKILQKLQSEASGIFNYCMDLYLKAKERGELTVSDASKVMLKEFKVTTSPLGIYLSEHFETEKYAQLDSVTMDALFKNTRLYGLGFNEDSWCRIPVDLIRKDYNEWSKDQGFKSEYNSVTFGREFKFAISNFIKDKHIIDNVYKKVKNGNKLTMCFVGLWSPFIQE
jgi:P4 family phage/plasmid primase-like protien